MSLLILVVDDEPDVEALFRQRFRRDIRDGRFTMDFAQSADSARKLISDAAGASFRGLFPLLMMSASGTNRTTSDVRSSFAIGGIADMAVTNRLPLGGDAPPAAKAIVDLTQWAKPGGEGGSGTDRGATQRGRGTGRRIGRANECANEEDGAPREVTAHRAPPIAASCFEAVGRGPPPIRSAPPAAMPRHCHRGTGSTF